ncbi:MAG: type II toxin-antitoxin system RelE/ParE family toxin [Desulfobacteraceae bacterium]|jgi:mRNA-degrading endonuclease YafQ of YafQ-DinJ toxin-antitoxin module
MNYKLIYTDSYINKAKRFVKKHPELIAQYEKTLKILENDPHHPSLRLHRLKGKLKDLHSISINISYRITLEFYLKDKEIVLVNVGHHDEVY